MESVSLSVDQLPENFAATRVILTVGPREISLILGHTRHLINDQSRTSPRIEWHASYSISPTTAAQIHGALSESLAIYEKQFGPIPKGP